MNKIILICCSIIPLVLQVPYLWSAWNSSRLDQWDWIFCLLAVPAIVWAVWKEKIGKADWWAAILLIPSAAAALTAEIHHVNSFAAASAVVVIFAAVWLIGSWCFACKILPAVMILLLGTPSSSYAISLLLMCPVWLAWLIKFVLAVAGFGWIWCSKRFDWQIRKGTLCFTAAIIASGLLLWHSKEIYFEGTSFIPEFPVHAGEYWGRSIEPDENTKRFFASSSVKQFRYTGNGVDISILAVKCGTDIHEIHPASHCLRTSSWTVNSERVLYLHHDFAVTEIDAEKGHKRFLTWVWYSGEDFSTPGFLGFRRHFRSSGNYYTYQISTPVNNDIEQSRNVLRRFMQILNDCRENKQ